MHLLLQAGKLTYTGATVAQCLVFPECVSSVIMNTSTTTFLRFTIFSLIKIILPILSLVTIFIRTSMTNQLVFINCVHMNILIQLPHILYL